MIDAREIARQLILSHAKDVEYLSIGEHLDGHVLETKALSEAKFDELQGNIGDLIDRATVLVIFPGDEYAKAVALLLRDFADMIDRGPDIPLPPSVYSALVRERADNLAGQADSAASA